MGKRAHFNIGKEYEGYSRIGGNGEPKRTFWESGSRVVVVVGLAFVGVMCVVFAITQHRDNDIESNGLRGSSNSKVPSNPWESSGIIDQEPLEQTLSAIMRDIKDAEQIPLENEHSQVSRIMKGGLSQEIRSDLTELLAGGGDQITMEEIEEMAKEVESSLETQADDFFVSSANVIIGDELEKVTLRKIQVEHEGLDTQGIIDNLLSYEVDELILVNDSFSGLVSQATDTLRAGKQQEELKVLEGFFSNKLGHVVHLELPTEEGDHKKFGGLSEALDSLSSAHAFSGNTEGPPDTTASQGVDGGALDSSVDGSGADNHSNPNSGVEGSNEPPSSEDSSSTVEGSNTASSVDVDGGDDDGSSLEDGADNQSNENIGGDSDVEEDNNNTDDTQQDTESEAEDAQAAYNDDFAQVEHTFEHDIRDAETTELLQEEQEIKAALESRKEDIRNGIVGLAGDDVNDKENVSDKEMDNMVEEVEEIVEEKVKMKLEAEADAEVSKDLENIAEEISEGQSEGVEENELAEEVVVEKAGVLADLKSDMTTRAKELENEIDSLTEAAETQVVTESGLGSP